MSSSSNTTITYCPKCGKDVVVPSSWAFMATPTLCPSCESQSSYSNWAKIQADIFDAIWEHISYGDSMKPETIWHCMPSSQSDLYVYQMCGEFLTHYRWKSKSGWNNISPSKRLSSLEEAKKFVIERYQNRSDSY